MASCENDLQMLFDIAYHYSKKWRFHFNPIKCVVVVFGKGNDTKIKLGKVQVSVKQCDKHLGVALRTTKASGTKFIKVRITACKKVCYGIQSLVSSAVPTSPVTASKLYKGVCLLKLCYGVDIMDINDESMILMESFHSTCTKTFQGQPIQSASPGCVGTMGWLCMESIVDMVRLIFMWQILNMSMSCIYKKIMLRRIVTLLDSNDGMGPTWNMIKTFIKYGIVGN